MRIVSFISDLSALPVTEYSQFHSIPMLTGSLVRSNCATEYHTLRATTICFKALAFRATGISHLRGGLVIPV